jgi:hypothetical protein
MTRLIVVFSVLLSSFADAFGQTTYKHPLPIQVAGCQNGVATLFWDTDTDGPVPECYLKVWRDPSADALNADLYLDSVELRQTITY